MLKKLHGKIRWFLKDFNFEENFCENFLMYIFLHIKRCVIYAFGRKWGSVSKIFFEI